MPDIGRFFNIDPLAEKYVYNGVYNFSENRVIDAVELEGLEAVKVTDLKNKTVNVTVRIKPVNATSGDYFDITNDQMKIAQGNIKSQAEKSWSGAAGKGMKVSVNIEWDENATLTAKFVNVIENPDATKIGGMNELDNARSPGFTSQEDVGNTQTGTFQIASAGTLDQAEDIKLKENHPESYVPKHGAGHTGNHELGHIFGNGENNSTKLNLMNQDGKGRNVTPEQRDTMLQNIPEFKP